MSTVANSTVRFGLVEFPVSVRKAAEKQDVKFDRASKDGNPIRRQEIDSETGEIITPDDVIYGVREGDDFHEIEQEKIDAIKSAGVIDGIEIEEFIPLKSFREEILPRVESSYYLTPQKGLVGAKPLRLLHDAMKAEKAAGVTKFMLKRSGGRQKLGVIYPHEGKVILSVVAFADDYRQADEAATAIEHVDVPKAHVAAARELVKASLVTEGPRMIDTATDTAVAEKGALVEAALENRPVVPSAPKQRPDARPADDLMAQLQESMKAAKAKPRKRVAA